MAAQVLFFNDFSEKDLHLNAIEDSLGVCDTSVCSNMKKYKCDVVTEKLILKTHTILQFGS